MPVFQVIGILSTNQLRTLRNCGHKYTNSNVYTVDAIDRRRSNKSRENEPTF